MTIQVLRKQGNTIKGIARDTGVARNTVKKYLHSQITQPTYSGRSKRPGKLAPFRDYLHKRIADAAPEWIHAAVLYDEILEQGYQGKIRILSSYLATLKPRTPPETLVRFETPPGKQLQVDFTIIRRGKDSLKAFVATLGHARASYVRFYDHERTEAWIDGLKRAFEFFGGVTEEVLFDNAKAIMIERDAYADGEHRWNAQLLSLANDYGFRPRTCRPYRAKTKGKVERFNRYLKSSFVVPLQAKLRAVGLTLDVWTTNGHIGPWLHKIANARVHGTTGEVPNERLVYERETLLPLPISNGIHTVAVAPDKVVPTPFESLQHPLSVYDEVIGGRNEFTV